MVHVLVFIFFLLHFNIVNVAIHNVYMINPCFLLPLQQSASMLELARLFVDSAWVPPRPIIFLFNGAEELFMLVRETLISNSCKGNHS